MTQRHTEIGGCTSDCRREGCPEEPERDYLAEAVEIIKGKGLLLPERAHLVALLFKMDFTTQQEILKLVRAEAQRWGHETTD